MLSPSASESTIVSPSLSNFDDFGSSLMPPLAASMLETFSIAAKKIDPDHDNAGAITTSTQLDPIISNSKEPPLLASSDFLSESSSSPSLSDLTTAEEPVVSNQHQIIQDSGYHQDQAKTTTPTTTVTTIVTATNTASAQPKSNISEVINSNANTDTNTNTMSATPSTTSPNGTPNLGQGMFSNTGAGAGVLRSPSLSSGTGSGINGGGSNNGSSSSATTTMTTTQASSLLGNNNGSGTTVIGSMSGSAGVSDVKLKRFLEHNVRLKEQLEMRRISVSEASQSLIKFVTTTKDSLLPSLWGSAANDPFSKQSSGCCIIS